MSLPIDAHIPVLTEIIPPSVPDAPEPAAENTQTGASAASAEIAARPAPESVAPSQSAYLAPAESAVPPAPAAPITSLASAAAAPDPVDLTSQAESGLSRQEWEELETQVRERVLLQLQHRIDFVLEQRVRDCLADALQLAVSHLADDIRQGLENSLKDVISGAVTQEIAKLKTERQF